MQFYFNWTRVMWTPILIVKIPITDRIVEIKNVRPGGEGFGLVADFQRAVYCNPLYPRWNGKALSLKSLGPFDPADKYTKGHAVRRVDVSGFSVSGPVGLGQDNAPVGAKIVFWFHAFTFTNNTGLAGTSTRRSSLRKDTRLWFFQTHCDFAKRTTHVLYMIFRYTRYIFLSSYLTIHLIDDKRITKSL